MHTPSPTLSEEHRAALLGVAFEAIAYRLDFGRALAVDAAVYPPRLRMTAATFVTLHHGAELRGCVGVLEAVRPLVEDVAHNAAAAAFEDPRFEPLAADELANLSIHISILSPAEPIAFTDEEDLLRQLRPGVDGLILEAQTPGTNGTAGRHARGTFLPAVWETTPDPREFLRQLKIKAGLGPDDWNDTIRVRRYTAESVG